MQKKRLNRWQRLLSALKHGPLTSWGIMRIVGTVTPSKCVSELRQHGFDVKSRKVLDGMGEKEYYLVRR